MSKFNLSFVCHKQWDELEITALPNIRFCDDCLKQVFVVKTQAEFLAASALNRCVALSDKNGLISRVGFVP